MGGRHSAGLSYRLSTLKPRASEKMGGLTTNKEDLFFSCPILSVENGTSEDVYIAYTFFLLSTIRIFSVKTEHLRTIFCSSN